MRLFFRVTPDILQRCRQNPSFCEDVLLGDEPGLAETFDADHAWDAIHYVLSPNRAFQDEGVLDDVLHFDYAITGKEPVHKRLDLGHGPACYVPAETVKEIADALGFANQQDMRAKYDPAAMDAAEVHPESWARESTAGWDYLWQHFERLRDFYQRAAREGHPVITWLVPLNMTAKS